MRKFKVASIVMAIVLVVCFATSCKNTSANWGNANFSEVFACNYEESVTPVNKELSLFTGYSVDRTSSSYGMISFYKAGTTATSNYNYYVYNINLDKTVYAYSGSENIYVTFPSSYYFVIEESEKTSYYQMNGTLLCDDGSAVYVSGNYVYVGDKKYEINEDKTLTEVNASVNDLAGSFNYDLEGDAQNYSYDNNSISVYNKANEIVYYYELDGTAESNIVPLSNENFLIQTLSQVDFLSDKYDIMVSSSYSTGLKYDLNQYIYNTITGKLEEVNLGFLVDSISNKHTSKTFNDTYKDTVKNVATVSKIVDKKLSDNDEYILLDDDLKVLGSINDYVTGQTNCKLVADNRFIVSGDNKYLFNENGQNLGCINGVKYNTEKYLITDKAIYDYNLNKLFDYSLNGYEFHSLRGQNIIFRQTNHTPSTTYYTYYIFNGNGVSQLFNTNPDESTIYDFDFYSNYYMCIEETSDIYYSYEYNYYNYDGSLIISSSSALTSITYGSNATVYRSGTGSTAKYFILH